ncbi:MAG TPA: LpqB family beta-propeller domain-containing protein [Candidatus Limnocylindria bacterium]|nr:LpqB family beta-propeller domain-containing protein [Candidatus Limnocylindria bacterium]
MPRRGLARIAAATVIGPLLGGCLPFLPPFLPWDPDVAPVDASLVVRNETNDDWVIVVDSGGPAAFAVPAGAAGEIPIWIGTPTAARLLDRDCTEVAELELELEPPQAGAIPEIVIDEPGVLRAGEPGSTEGDLPMLAEYFECGVVAAAIEPGEGATGASGSLTVHGENGGLWSVNPATGEATLLVGDDGDFLAAGYTLSPDGSRVAIATWDEETYVPSIAIADADGSDERLLVENGDFPTWSPDGTRIAYIDADPFAGGSALTVIDADGGEPRRLAAQASWMAWSPDGTRIAFIADATHDEMFDSEEPGTLWVVDVESGDVTELAATAPFSAAPAWSPDGSLIAFVGGTIETTDLRVIDADGGNERVVSEGDGASFTEPAWSPDGSRLAAVSYEFGFVALTTSVIIVDPTGAEADRVVVTSSEDSFYAPTWSPDGAWLALTRTDVSFRSSTVVVDLEDGSETTVARNTVGIAGWRP